MKRKPETVEGPVSAVLRAGRLCGIAPVTFHDWGIALSTKICVMSFVFIGLCDLTELSALVMDLLLTGTDDGYRTPTWLHALLWMPDLGLNFTSGTVGVLGAPARMNKLIRYMELVEKIKADLKYRGTGKRVGRRRTILIFTMLAFLSCLAATDYYVFLRDGLLKNRNMMIVYFYCGFYGQFSMWLLLEMQFVISMITTNDLIQVLNNQLNEILVTVSTKKNDHGDFVSLGIYPETIQRLSISYSDIVSVIKQIDAAHGPGMLILTLMMIMDLTVTPYYLMLELIHMDGRTVDAVLMALWTLFMLVNLSIMIEPGHGTQVKISRTRALVSALALRVRRSEPLSAQLRGFSRQLLLQTNNYSIMGFASLGRPLVASIFGTVTTFLVIVLQFHLSGESDEQAEKDKH